MQLRLFSSTTAKSSCEAKNGPTRGLTCDRIVQPRFQPFSHFYIRLLSETCGKSPQTKLFCGFRLKIFSCMGSRIQPFSLLVQKPCWLAYTWYIFLGIATNYFVPRLVEKNCELISRNYPHALLLPISFSFFNRRLGMHGNGKARPFSLL